MERKIGYLGPEGNFSWKAAQAVIETEKRSIIPFFSFWEGMQFLVERKADEILLPIENSSGGGIEEVISLLRRMPEDLRIEKEIKLSIEQYLLVLNGSEISDVEKVFSMGKIFGQCRNFLNERKIICQAVESTIKAAELVVKGNNKRTAVIGAEWLSEFFPELEVVAKINDNSSNTTRFILIGRENTERTGNDKTSIILSVYNKVGALVEVLEVLRNFGINMTMIVSIPTGKQLGDYDFLIDIEGHILDKNIKEALTAIKEKTTSLKILGSYSVL